MAPASCRLGKLFIRDGCRNPIPGSYCDRAMNKTNQANRGQQRASSLFIAYATFAAEQLPFIWMPNNYLVQAVRTLYGVTFNPLYTFLPEYWYFTR